MQLAIRFCLNILKKFFKVQLFVNLILYETLQKKIYLKMLKSAK